MSNCTYLSAKTLEHLLLLNNTCFAHIFTIMCVSTGQIAIVLLFVQGFRKDIA